MTAGTKTAMAIGRDHQLIAVTLDRDEEVPFKCLAENEAEDQWWPQPLEVLHCPAEKTEEQE